MADFTKFRTAMGGFKRSDVTNYIENLCIEHAQTVKKLQQERDALQEQVSDTTARLDEQTAAAEDLRQKLQAAETSLSSTEAALNEAMEMIEEQKAAEPTPDYASMELEAYRRAEATERLASERAMRLRQKLDDLLDGVSTRYEQSGQEIQVLSEDLRNNLQRLQETLSDLELIFSETTEHFDTLDDEELPVPHIHAVV